MIFNIQMGEPMYRPKTIMLTLLFSCLAISGYAATPKLRQTLGGKNLDTLKNAKFVTILAMIPEGNTYEPEPEIHLTNDEITRLKRQLLDDHNYAFDKYKKCKFVPELSFKFQDEEGETVHVFVSPSCNQVLFTMGRKSALLNYEPAYERLENYFQQLVKETRQKNRGRYRA